MEVIIQITYDQIGLQDKFEDKYSHSTKKEQSQ